MIKMLLEIEDEIIKVDEINEEEKIENNANMENLENMEKEHGNHMYRSKKFRI